LLLNVLIGIILGTFLGLGTVLFIEILNPRVRSDEDLTQLLGVPMLGKIGPTKVNGRRGKLWRRNDLALSAR